MKLPSPLCFGVLKVNPFLKTEDLKGRRKWITPPPSMAPMFFSKEFLLPINSPRNLGAIGGIIFAEKDKSKKCNLEITLLNSPGAISAELITLIKYAIMKWGSVIQEIREMVRIIQTGDSCGLSCTRLRVPPVALHVSRYTCRS